MKITNFKLRGQEVKVDENERVNLTDLWKISGSQKKDEPDRWYRLDSSKDFISVVATNLKTPEMGVWISKRGNGGGTFSHWQIALAYAKWISPEFHMEVNTIFMQYQNGDPKIAMDVMKNIPKAYRSQSLTKIASKASFHRFEALLVDRGVVDQGGLYNKRHFMNAMYRALYSKDAVELREDLSLAHRENVKESLPDNELKYISLIENTVCDVVEEDASIYGYTPVMSVLVKVALDVSEFRQKTISRQKIVQTNLLKKPMAAKG